MSLKDFALNFGGGRRLVLAGIERGWIWLLVGVIALALMIVLYRYERKLVSRRTGLTLLGMRVLAALALVAALFEPIAERSIRETLRGRIILGVDISDSMATADPGRTPENREQLRKTLDLSPAETPETLPRREVVRRLLKGRWLREAEKAHAFDTYGFARETAAGTPDTLAEMLLHPTKPDETSGQMTDWEPVLDEALKDRAGAPVVGVVLMTDGRRNAPPAANPALERLKERGIPVFPVLVGSTTPPRDAAVAAIRAPDTIDKGQVAKIDVLVKVDGVPAGTDVPVTLERPGGSPLRRMVRAQPDGGRPVVTFRVPCEAVGEQALSVAVGPIDADVRPDNDRRAFKIVVTDDKARILLVDAEARWEFQYLRNALMRDPRVSLDAILFHQPTAARLVGTSYPATLPTRPDDSKQPDPLNAYDAIIVGDVGLDDLDEHAWRRLEKYVSERGGTLVFSAGPRSWPTDLTQHEVVRRLLPVHDTHVVPVDPSAIDATRPSLPAGVAILPTAEAAAGPWPMLVFADEPERSQSVWASLPLLPWMMAGKPKPSATVLVAASTPASREDEATVMAAMPYGLGKVLWVGTDGTWRWRFRVGDAYHHRFWGQVAQWSTRGKLTSGNRLVQFGPVPPRVPEGESALIRARFADDAPGVTSDLLVAARVFRAAPKDKASGESTVSGEPVAVVTLRAKADQPRMFEASAPVLPAGSYVIRLDVPQLAEALQSEGIARDPEASLEVIPRETSERIELAAARDPLDQLASTTGGRVVLDSEINTLPDLLRKQTVVTTRVEPTRLWDRPEALILFFAFLTVEWVLRKRAGLP
jgi:hypothetical protein